jgi:four helix bundle protein
VCPTRYDLEDRLVRFAAGVCRLSTRLPPTAVGKHITVQVIRSGTSPLANSGEVQGAESRRDFVHKLGICVKELRETRAWLKLVTELRLSPDDQLAPMLRECDELLAITASSIKTARQNRETQMENAECPMFNDQWALNIDHSTLDIVQGTLAAAYSPTASRPQYHRR